MKKGFLSGVLAAVMALPLVVAAPASAQPRDYRWHGDRDRHWDPAPHYRPGGNYRERRMGRNDRMYRGRDGRYYCRRNDGTTGLVVGAIAGGLLGNAIGGDALGTLLGAGGGALLGQSIDKGNVRCR